MFIESRLRLTLIIGGPTRKEKKKRWCSRRTRAAKFESRKLYSQARKDIKNSIKENKRKYVEDLAQEAEEAAGSGNMA